MEKMTVVAEVSPAGVEQMIFQESILEIAKEVGKLWAEIHRLERAVRRVEK